MYASFWSLARLSFPEMRTEYLAQAPPPDPSPQRQARLPPDDHLLCYDYLFYAGVSLRVRPPFSPSLALFPLPALPPFYGERAC